ncbi:hypothetical protein GTY54_43730, partial [Streptomyces sp. SID625]|nr:hypothetical protein [Streptomyces sp. SID625]
MRYIVVGGGSTGSVLAAWLSEDADVQVLLLEASSGEPLEAMAVPPAWLILRGSDADWADTTVPQAALHGKQVGWPRGRGLGGSSSINGMVCSPTSAAATTLAIAVGGTAAKAAANGRPDATGPAARARD